MKIFVFNQFLTVWAQLLLIFPVDLLILLELEHQYSPSRWSNRFSEPSEVINHHCQVVTAASERAKSKVPYETEISYGQRQGQKLDVFGGTRLPNSSPIFVFIHGGYWQELSKNISSYCVAPLFDAGIRVVIVGYDLAPKVKLETIVEEIEEAAVYIMKYAIQLGSRSVVFGGHSAGAHLLAMLLSSVWYSKLHDDQRKLINGFILFSGVFDLKPIVNTYINDALNLSQSDARLLSPMFLDIKHSGCEKLPRILVVVGQYDSPAFREQSKRYAQKLQHENYEVSLLTIPDVDHFDIVANLDGDEYILVKTIIEFIKS